MTKADTLFLASVLTLPLQLNKFFFPAFSFILGIPIDYRAVTIYLSDILILIYIISFLIENSGKLKNIYQKQKNFINALFLLNFYLLINSLFTSTDTGASLLFSIKTIEFSLFAVCASITLSKKKIFNLSLIIIAFSLFWQSLLVISQFIFQKSLGLWLLGERAFDTSTVSIAHVQFLNTQWLRPYGTFPHPNGVGAFLVISLILIVYNRRIFSTELQKFLNYTLSVIAIFAIFITFSKASILALVSAFIINSSKIKEFAVKAAILPILLIIFLLTISQGQIASIAERLTLSQTAFNIALINPLFGIGSNNFILELSRLNLFSVSDIRLLQPVHNIFLLILAENGIIGLLLFAYLLYCVFINATSKVKIALYVAILIFASVDHYLWTLHQGRFLFFLTTAYILAQKKSESRHAS